MKLPHPVMLATEDALSEAVCIRLLQDVDGRLVASPTRFRKGGFGYLRSRIGPFIQIADRLPLLLLTDLDQASCPSVLIASWTRGRALPDRLLFRIAVHEVESWLLADHEGLLQLMGARIGRLPEDTDAVADPKSRLLGLALKAPRELRADLVAEKGSAARQGLGYNVRLVAFVQSVWSPERAATRSLSLKRARARLHELADRLDAASKSE